MYSLLCCLQNLFKWRSLLHFPLIIIILIRILLAFTTVVSGDLLGRLQLVDIIDIIIACFAEELHSAFMDLLKLTISLHLHLIIEEPYLLGQIFKIVWGHP